MWAKQKAPASIRRAAMWTWVYSPVLTILALLTIELTSRYFIKIEDPSPFYLTLVVVVAFYGGLDAGLLSATLILLHAFYIFSLAGGLDPFKEFDALRMVLVSLGIPVVAAMVGRLKRRAVERSSVLEEIVRSLKSDTAAIGVKALEKSQAAETPSVFDDFSDLFFRLDPDGTILEYNTGGEGPLAKLPAHHLGEKIQTIIPSTVGTQFQSALTMVQKTGSLVAIEYSIADDDGTQTYEARLLPSPDEQILAIIRNITDRKKVEQAIREGESSFHLLFANNPFPMWVYELSTLKFLEVNEAAISHYGYTRTEFLRMRVSDLLPEEDVARLEQSDKNASAQFQFSGVWKHRFKSGNIADVELTSQSCKYAGKKAALVMAQDITERRRADDDLRKALSLLGATIESTADGILVVDRDGKITRCNQKFAQMWKIPPDLLEKGDDSAAIAFVAEQLTDPDKFLGKIQELYSSPEAESHDILEFKDGRVFERYSMPQRIGGDCVGRVWSFRDITDQRRSENQIQKQVQRLAALRAIEMAITASLDLRLTLNVLVDQVTSRLGVDAAAILLHKPHLHALQYAAGRGFRTNAIQRSHLKLDEDCAGQAVLTREVIHVSDLSQTDGRFTRAGLLAEEGFAAYLAVPLLVKGEAKGVLEIFHRTPLRLEHDWQ
ncbi:MAG: PAS domain-containing protein, partial [bacterium]